MTINRWEAAYQKYLKSSPKDKKFINKNRKMDKEALLCMRNQEPEKDPNEGEWQDFLDYDSAQELAV